MSERIEKLMRLLTLTEELLEETCRDGYDKPHGDEFTGGCWTFLRSIRERIGLEFQHEQEKAAGNRNRTPG
ncbi:hypothetical protein LCGC14_1156420 [marine sediment metagenome]|uniref:Uncharacterized protein n=1 Tax=marine sediment metagenome TaxID=412755 RepID=A0A0F9LTX9_9ZZZZ